MPGETALDSSLQLIDAMLADLATRVAMYVGRRADEGDDETFVIQTGEEGRKRLPLPASGSDRSIAAVIAKTQTHLIEVFAKPLPLCPCHDHALVGKVSLGRATWVCPDNGWCCEVGEYEYYSWPQRELGTALAPILSRRLKRRGTNRAVRTIGVRVDGDQLVAEFGITKHSSRLIALLEDVSDPLPVQIRSSPDVMLRPLPGSTT